MRRGSLLLLAAVSLGIAAAIGGCGGLFDQPPQDYPSLSPRAAVRFSTSHGEPDTEVTVSELSVNLQRDPFDRAAR